MSREPLLSLYHVSRIITSSLSEFVNCAENVEFVISKMVVSSELTVSGFNFKSS